MSASLGSRLYAVAHREGSFVLRSGAPATEYFDKFRFTGDPALLREVVNGLAALVPANADVLAGLELGGVPLASALSMRTGLPVSYVRKSHGPEGEGAVVGADVVGANVVVVDDVLSTGGAVLDAVEKLRSVGAEVTTALMVIDRESGGREHLRDAQVDLRALFRMSEIEPPA